MVATTYYPYVILRTGVLTRFVVSAALVIAVAGCGDDSDDSSTTTTSSTSSTIKSGTTSNAPATVEVPIQNFAFATKELTVKPGTTVRWINKDSMNHTVTSGKNRTSDGDFDKDLAPGESFEFKFAVAGTFDYFCKPHANMNAKVIVQ